MEATILLLPIGFGAGFYVRGRRAKRHVDARDKQIGVLRSEIVAMHDAETSRLDDAARRQRFFKENDVWPAAGFVDTEIGCFMKPEVAYATKTIWA